MSAVLLETGEVRPVTFAYLAELEPGLRALEREARGAAARREGAHRAFYGPAGLKSRLVRLVGWSRRERDQAAKPDLHTSEAYDLAYGHVLAILEGRQ